MLRREFCVLVAEGVKHTLFGKKHLNHANSHKTGYDIFGSTAVYFGKFTIFRLGNTWFFFEVVEQEFFVVAKADKGT